MSQPATLIVWGANSAIAQAVAQLFAARDWRVIGVAHQHTTPHAPYETLWSCDLSDATMIDSTALQIAQQYGSEVDAMLFAAGRMHASKIRDTSAQLWQRIVADNLTSAHLTTTASLALLRADATMMYLSAYSANIQLPNIGAYAASKAALEAYLTVLGKEERQKRIIAYRMGAVDTPLWQDAPFKLPRGAYSPADMANKILAQFDGGARGAVDC
jgi:3-oxoacyl-[acyl-carrier protein] reductase